MVWLDWLGRNMIFPQPMPPAVAATSALQRINRQNENVVFNITSRASPTAMIRLLLLDG